MARRQFKILLREALILFVLVSGLVLGYGLYGAVLVRDSTYEKLEHYQLEKCLILEDSLSREIDCPEFVLKNLTWTEELEKKECDRWKQKQYRMIADEMELYCEKLPTQMKRYRCVKPPIGTEERPILCYVWYDKRP
ncbi:MAG: hypothetical protein ABH950_08995 [Candidatus Altiarchaeota archaeon]